MHMVDVECGYGQSTMGPKRRGLAMRLSSGTTIRYRNDRQATNEAERTVGCDVQLSNPLQMKCFNVVPEGSGMAELFMRRFENG